MASPTTPSAPTTTESGGMRQTLGLTGVTVNAMALIAPGAFLWLTFAGQAAQTAGSQSTAKDMVSGLLLALVLAFLTAYCYSQLANLFPKAGTGSSYYFAEAALLSREETQHYRFARVAKFVVGWSSHLYYWVYPGLMVGVFSALVQFIAGLFNVPFAGAIWFAYGVAIIMAIGVGAIAYRGIVGSTSTAIAINIIQIVSLIVLSVLAIIYRLSHGGNHYDFSSAVDVVAIHNFANVVFQATIAILLLVGFESITALGAEAKDPKKNIPRGILLSLLIQGLIMYVFEYFAANFFMGSQYKNSGGTGLAAASTALAPIGDMAHIIGDWLGGWGFMLAIIIGATVALAIIGTTLSCLNTGVRVTFAMGKDKEVPSFLGLLHGKYRVPHTAVLVLTGLTALIGVYCSTGFGVFTGVDTFSQITYISNIGTLLLYGMTCTIVFVAYHKGVEGYSFLKHRVAPALGLLANLGLLVGVFYLAFTGGNVAPNHTETDALIAISFVGVFIIAGIVILFVNSAGQKRALLHTEHPGFEA